MWGSLQLAKSQIFKFCLKLLAFSLETQIDIIYLKVSLSRILSTTRRISSFLHTPIKHVHRFPAQSQRFFVKKPFFKLLPIVICAALSPVSQATFISSQTISQATCDSTMTTTEASATEAKSSQRMPVWFISRTSVFAFLLAFPFL